MMLSATRQIADKLFTVATVIACAFAIIVVSQRVRDRPRSASIPTGEPVAIRDWESYQSGEIVADAPGSPATMVIFSDFECPFCAKLSRYVDSLSATDSGSDIRILWRHYPIHAEARSIAEASICASRQGQFNTFRRVVFLLMDSLSTISTKELARRAGVDDEEAFTTCLADPSISQRVSADSAAGVHLEVSGTPTLLINDTRIKGFLGDSMMNLYVGRAIAGKPIADQ